ncbi:MAG: hypothetical protein ABR509_02365 [Candidatus Limnocylindria bacterium]
MAVWMGTLLVATASVVVVTQFVRGDGAEHFDHLAIFVLMCVTLVAAIWDGRRRGLAARRAPER